MSPGKYYHFGLLRGLLKICENIIEAPGIISLFVNYDGVPMTKSSNVSRWPILGHVREISDDPFIVGIYCGPGQPDNTYDVIADFVKETNGLEAKGIFINGNHVEVHVSAFIVDQPGRTKLTGSVSHCSYHGCPRCTTKGVYVVRPNEKNGRVTFPETRAPRRTDESFRRREHPEHHSRDMGRSPVEDLRTNMVDIFLQRNCISWILEQLRRLYYSLSKSTHQQD